MQPGRKHVRRNPPHRDELLIKVGYLRVVIRHQNAVSGGLERGSHHGQRMGQLFGLALQLLLGRAQIPLRFFAREQDRVGGLERGGAEEFFLVVRLH